jgi:DNA-binding GntR family transcriptional regulator
MDTSNTTSFSNPDIPHKLGRGGTEGPTAGELAYQHIRSDIIFGRLRPGQKLPIEKLRSVYGVSVGTLREIFCQLTPEGFVTAEGQRGFRVAPCSAADLRELASLRLLVERHGIEQSFRAGEVEWEARVVAAHHKLAWTEISMLAGDRSQTEQWKQYDWQFHQALVSACDSQALMTLHSGLYDRYLRYLMVLVVFRGKIAADEHKELLDCALRRDVTNAQRILTAHVEGCVEHALKQGLVA